MAWLKFSADNLFTGTALLDNNHVLITDEKGTIETISAKADAGEDVQVLTGILSPGLINCHCHLELSHMRGLIPEKTGLVDFVFKVVTQRHFADTEILEAISNAEDEMLANGIVAVGDICNNTLTLPQKLKQRLAYYNFIEVSGWLPQIAEARFERSKGFYDEFSEQSVVSKQQAGRKEKEAVSEEDVSMVNGQWSMVNKKTALSNQQSATTNHQPQTTNSLSPHASYSVSNELWNLIQPYFKNKTITIHNQETSFEDELFKNGTGDFLRMYQLMKLDNSFFKPTGKSSLQSYYSKLSEAKNIILVHNTFTKEEDVSMVNGQWSMVNGQWSMVNKKTALSHQRQTTTNHQPPTTNSFFCICINANLYIENKVPPIDMLVKNDCNIVLGTDSLASNHSLNLLDEMKNIHKYFPQINTAQLLQWATLNGAKALQMDDKLGSFEKGKQPGVVCISPDLSTLKRWI